MSTTHANIDTPSQAYKVATLSLVYRLSELTFGSLLAAYSLGFVAAIGAHWVEMTAQGYWGIVLLSLQYALISITFAYLTTSFYLTYHAGILTMPQLSLDRLGIDFALAIAQALFFGISMLRPWSFPILLGLSLCLTGYRQRQEHRALADALYKVICKPDVRVDAANFAEFRRGLAKYLRAYPQLSGWAPTGLRIWVTAALMITVGVAIGYLVVESLPIEWPYRRIWDLRTESIRRQALITCEVLLFTLPITVYGHLILKQRATFLQISNKKRDDSVSTSEQIGSDGDDKRACDRTPEVDLQFYKLQKKLEELCTS